MLPSQVKIDKHPYPKSVLNEFKSEWNGFVDSRDHEPDQDHDSVDNKSNNAKNTDVYFNSYSYIGIHEEMLKDSVRTGIYFKTVMTNQHLFRDKVVLDIGCGTGILSLFSAKAGAKKVYAIDNSSIIDLARKITKVNGLSDKIVYIKSKVEDLDENTIEPVDVIISEWMGYFLLYENMIESVLYCRDKYLRPGGLIFPDRARIYIAAIEDHEYKAEKFDKWDDTYGLDFSLVKEHLMEEALVDFVDEKSLVTSSFCIFVSFKDLTISQDVNLNDCSPSDTDFCSNFVLVSERRDYVHAFVFWFDVTFASCDKPLTLTTSPRSKYTHWKQTVLYIEEVLNLQENDLINGIIAVKKNKDNPRDVDIKLSYQINDNDPTKLKCHYYRIK